VIEGAYLIDGTGAEPVPSCAIVVEGDRIAALLPGGRGRTAAGDRVLDVGGRTVMPGLFNCHVHLQMDGGRSPLEASALAVSAPSAPARAESMLRRGITTMRDCGARDSAIVTLAKDVKAGRVRGPRIVACGRPLCATGGHAPALSEPVRGEEQIRQACRRQLDDGAEFIKVMATGGFGKEGEQLDVCELTVAELAAAAEVAHEAGRKLAVHAYGNQGIRNALAAGADTIEHATFLDEETVGILKERQTFIVPTLANTYRVATEGQAGGLSAYMVGVAERVFPVMMETFRLAYRAGVRVALGTDAGSWLNPHTDIVTELRLRIRAGATPLDVIRMATGESAACCGLAHETGTIAPGKLADLVILNANPLEDISAVEDLYRVYLGGVEVHPAEPTREARA
jgi:imidazolonepropionase-like amidohydrolase